MILQQMSSIGFDPAIAMNFPLVVAAMALLLAVGSVVESSKKPAEPPMPRLDDDHLVGLLAGLSAAVAHEIRNPLSSLKGHAQLLSRSTDGELENRAQRILQDVARVERAVADLIGLWDMKPWSPRATNPAQVATTWALSTRYGPIRVDVSAAPGRWTLDSDRLAHALEFLARTMRAQSNCEKPIDLVVAAVDDSLVMTLGGAGGATMRADDQPLNRRREPDIVHRSSFAMADHVARQHGGLASNIDADGGSPCFRLTFGRL